jgi:hypothetical protein
MPITHMPNEPASKPTAAERLRESLSRAQAVRSEANMHPVRSERRRQLKQWQVERLSRTFADLLAHPRYGPPARFFRSDLYGTKDVDQRDRDIERMYPAMVHMLPANALDTVAIALELDALSEELDHDLAIILWDELKCESDINDAIYTEAYQRSGKYKERQNQITLIVELGHDLDKLVHTPFLYASLRLMRQPAKVAGLGELQSFLERGFTAFHDMGSADEFLAIIHQRETAILDRIFAGHPKPFECD